MNSFSGISRKRDNFLKLFDRMNDEKKKKNLMLIIDFSRTWSSHVPFSSQLSTTDKLTVGLPSRRANTSTDTSDDVGESVSCIYILNECTNSFFFSNY